MSRIYWETMLFVYVLEGSPEFGSKVSRLIVRMRERSDTLYTSVFTLGELLVRPIRERNEPLAHRIRETLGSPSVELIALSRPVMERYAQIRGSQSVRAADALHLACAAESGTDLFLTNDRRLHRLSIPGIQFIAGIDSELL